MDRTSRWHMLQISDVLDEELCSALAQHVAVTGWRPQPSILRAVLGGAPMHRATTSTGNFDVKEFPALRGYARLPAWLGNYFAQRLVRWMRSAGSSEQDVLVCTAPYFAGVAERWHGPVVYWLTDMIAQYGSAHGIDVPALDRRLCAASTLVCPNSLRLAEYLQQQGCDPEKILILPNATRKHNVLPAPITLPEPLAGASPQARPTAGIIGNLAGNMDWVLLEATIRSTPWLQWVFVGPTDMPIADVKHKRARTAVQKLENALFTGRKPYGELAAYARSFHVAVLPYLRCEPTYSGSSTRFYEHLAACRPMLATRGFEELLRKEPLLQLVDAPEEMTEALESLRAKHFEDGHEMERWSASRTSTWENRAEAMQEHLFASLSRKSASDCLLSV